MQKSTIFDLKNSDYASYPSVSIWPFMNPIVMDYENATWNLL